MFLNWCAEEFLKWAFLKLEHFPSKLRFLSKYLFEEHQLVELVF